MAVAVRASVGGWGEWRTMGGKTDGRQQSNSRVTHSKDSHSDDQFHRDAFAAAKQIIQSTFLRHPPTLPPPSFPLLPSVHFLRFVAAVILSITDNSRV